MLKHYAVSYLRASQRASFQIQNRSVRNGLVIWRYALLESSIAKSRYYRLLATPS